MVKKKGNIAEIEKRIYSKILKPEKKGKKGVRKVQISQRDKIIAFLICFGIIIFTFACIYYYNMFIDLTFNVEANLAQIETQVQKRKNLIINLGKTVVDYSNHERELFAYLGELRANITNRNLDNYLKSLDKLDNQGNQLQNKANLNEDLANERELLNYLGELRINIANQNLDNILGSLDKLDDQSNQIKNSANLSEDLLKWEKTLSQLMAVAEQYPDLKLSDNFIKYMDAILEFENKIAELRMVYNISVNLYSTKRSQFPGNVFASVFKFGEYPYFKLDSDENSFIYVEY